MHLSKLHSRLQTQNPAPFPPRPQSLQTTPLRKSGRRGAAAPKPATKPSLSPFPQGTTQRPRPPLPKPAARRKRSPPGSIGQGKTLHPVNQLQSKGESHGCRKATGARATPHYWSNWEPPLPRGGGFRKQPVPPRHGQKMLESGD